VSAEKLTSIQFTKIVKPYFLHRNRIMQRKSLYCVFEREGSFEMPKNLIQMNSGKGRSEIQSNDRGEFQELFGVPTEPFVKGLRQAFVQHIFTRYEIVRNWLAVEGLNGFVDALTLTSEWEDLQQCRLNAFALEEWGIDKELLWKIFHIISLDETHFDVKDILYWELITLNELKAQTTASCAGFPYDIETEKGVWFKPSTDEVKKSYLLDKMFCYSLKVSVLSLPVMPCPPEGYLILYPVTSWKSAKGIAREVEIPDSENPLDFGRGFYLTDSINFAIKWGKWHGISRYNGEVAITVFFFPRDFEKRCTRVINFSGNQSGWVTTVKDFRSKSPKEPSILEDVIVGPICMSVSLVNQCSTPVPRQDNQFCLKTEAALDLLQFHGIIFFKQIPHAKSKSPSDID
jgi:hypothetical protein